MTRKTKTESRPAHPLLAGVAVASIFLFISGHTAMADEDLQLWSPTQIVHAITKDVSMSMQIEGRFEEDITKFQELVLKPAVH